MHHVSKGPLTVWRVLPLSLYQTFSHSSSLSFYPFFLTQCPNLVYLLFTFYHLIISRWQHDSISGRFLQSFSAKSLPSPKANFGCDSTQRPQLSILTIPPECHFLSLSLLCNFKICLTQSFKLNRAGGSERPFSPFDGLSGLFNARNQWLCINHSSGKLLQTLGRRSLIWRMHRLVNLGKIYSQVIKNCNTGNWLWLSWQSGCFRYQRSAVRIQTLENFYRRFFYCQLYCIEKPKIIEKEAGNDPFLKTVVPGINPRNEIAETSAAFKLGS